MDCNTYGRIPPIEGISAYFVEHVMYAECFFVFGFVYLACILRMYSRVTVSIRPAYPTGEVWLVSRKVTISLLRLNPRSLVVWAHVACYILRDSAPIRGFCRIFRGT